MADNPASHFGRQLRKERLGNGWSLDELARNTSINAAHLSRIENGHRPPTEKVATACDAAFPSRRGWFLEYFTELQRWAEVPSWFRPWAEYEMSTTALHVWSPSVIAGLLQAEDYARAIVSEGPGITPEQVSERVANRMARQKRVLFRDDPPRAWFLIDITSLRRMAASGPVMAAQLRHLLAVSELPNVTIQVVPECVHAGLLGGFTVADGAAYAESVVSGQVFTDEETVSTLARRFDTIRGEAMRVSESAALLREMAAHERLAQVKLQRRQRRGLRRDSQR
ncbi:MAG: hypothetical protein QOG28_2276 [Trebonia sp.]|jgi:transcriptional regulator with XRE-family HTH domain|nr:putative transcriptional regulator, family [Actinomycetes bacterium]MDX6417656.1 hypothetical protein [Trebonia sp.]